MCCPDEDLGDFCLLIMRLKLSAKAAKTTQL